MNDHLDPERLKIPAYLRNKAIVSQAKQKLILTALDRKEAGLSYKSKKALAPTKTPPRRRFKSLLAKPRPVVSRAIQPHHRAPIIEDQESTAPSNPSENLFTSDQKLWAVGKVTNFIDKISVAIIMLSGVVKQGDLLLIEGEDYLFLQPVDEMQIERQPVTKAKKGSHIGLKVSQNAKVNGKVYKVAGSTSAPKKSRKSSHQLSGQLSLDDTDSDFDTPLI